MDAVGLSRLEYIILFLSLSQYYTTLTIINFFIKHSTTISNVAELSLFCPCQVTQLTGFSDPVYAEAYVHINQYDIVLDVVVVNQTSDTLQNCTLELATLGDLKLVEKPQPVVLAPRDFCNIKANVKVM